jgi:hypothetical protein
VTVDAELEVWRGEWRERTEPFPMLKRKIRRQNLRTVAAVAAIVICLALSTSGALRTGNSFLVGLAVGIGFAGALQGSYAWWARRGAWGPAAQTTLAYAELAYKRAVASARTTRFSFRFLLIATLLGAGLVAWHWREFLRVETLVLVAMVIELFLLNDNRVRAQKAVPEAAKLMEQTRQFADAEAEER